MNTLVGKKTTESTNLSLYYDDFDNSYFFKLYKQFEYGTCEIVITRAEVKIDCKVAVISAKDMVLLTKTVYTANHIFTHFDQYVKDMTP